MKRQKPKSNIEQMKEICPEAYIEPPTDKQWYFVIILDCIFAILFGISLIKYFIV